jgi:hypothetical protein
MKLPTRTALAMASVVVLGGITVAVAPQAQAVIQSIGGDVTCINWLQQASQPVGIWVDYDNEKGGWATLVNLGG